MLLAAQRPDVPVLLLHGDADEVVPTPFSTDFAAALSAGGHPVTLSILPGEDHGEVYAAEVAVAPDRRVADQPSRRTERAASAPGQRPT